MPARPQPLHPGPFPLEKPYKKRHRWQQAWPKWKATLVSGLEFKPVLVEFSLNTTLQAQPCIPPILLSCTSSLPKPAPVGKALSVHPYCCRATPGVGDMGNQDHQRRTGRQLPLGKPWQRQGWEHRGLQGRTAGHWGCSSPKSSQEHLVLDATWDPDATWALGKAWRDAGQSGTAGSLVPQRNLPRTELPAEMLI